MLQHKKLFLFDIDGTVAIGNAFLDGSLALFSYIASIGGKSVFITNNSTKSIHDYIAKFAGMGLRTDESNFVTASLASAIYLKEFYGRNRIHVMGTHSLLTELRGYGLNVTIGTEPDIACVLVGYDSELTYQKVQTVCQLLYTRNVDYLATNPDLACPIDFGMVPDCGAICKLIECAVGRKPYYIGKPNRTMVDLSLKQTGFTPEQTLVIGDRLYTDIACGINAGVDTALVFTGEAKPSDLANTTFLPTYTFSSVKELLLALKSPI